MRTAASISACRSEGAHIERSICVCMCVRCCVIQGQLTGRLAVRQRAAAAGPAHVSAALRLLSRMILYFKLFPSAAGIHTHTH